MTFFEISGFIIIALIAFTIVTGARVAYGSWFWELRKSWWHTKPEIEKLLSDLERSANLLESSTNVLKQYRRELAQERAPSSFESGSSLEAASQAGANAAKASDAPASPA
jgi:hypothetical protein